MHPAETGLLIPSDLSRYRRSESPLTRTYVQEIGFFIRLSLRDGISHYESGTNSASAAMLSDEK